VTWLSVIVAGILTYITRMTMITLVDRRVLGVKLRQVLGYVPSAVFPAIIFPAIFFNEYGNLIELTDPKIYGALFAIVVGYLSRNIIATIFSGLISYWIIIFLL
jgi:branched-subunit amino acid transport protein